jgi:toxin ParE1/3/4
MSEKFKINITPEAEKDLDEIWLYIAKDYSSRAEMFIKTLEKKIDALEIFPERCPKIRHSMLNGEYRQLIYGNYRIIFRVEKKQVDILRVIHTARLLEFGE